MKKLAQAVLVSLFAAIFILFFAGCAGTEQGDIMPDNPWTIKGYTRELGNVPGLDIETEWRILRDYLRQYIEFISQWGDLANVDINEIYISRYYGTHNGYVVVTIHDPYIFIPGIPSSPIVIDGIAFPWYWPSFMYFTAWNNGRFYGIQRLFVSGLLTRDDLLSIAQHDHPENSKKSILEVER